MIVLGLIFYIFAIVMIVSALTVVLVKNPVYSVLCLILCFFSASGIFMILGAEFIAMVMIIVYVGAVAVLFLFVVMMLNINFVKLKDGFQRYLPLCLIIASVLFIDLYLVINSSVNQPNVLFAKPAIAIPSDKDITNTHAIGSVLYTEYFYPFQISGIILLVAMIGSIVLTHRVRENVKKQNIADQLARKREACMELVTPESGMGVK
jgi:NADH-quinone oxidoreductase subunit J